jgi:hypothetical protein
MKSDYFGQQCSENKKIESDKKRDTVNSFPQILSRALFSMVFMVPN